MVKGGKTQLLIVVWCWTLFPIPAYSKNCSHVPLRILAHLKNVKSEKKKKICGAGHRWLTPVILATQEAENRRITVGSQPGQIVHETLS
jgi:hypothetical protein